MYFADCTTVEAVEARKRALALQLHPDRGGRHEDMVEMMRQYEARKAAIEAGRRGPQHAPYQDVHQAPYQESPVPDPQWYTPPVRPAPAITPADVEAFIQSWAPVVVEGVKAFEAIRSVLKDVERRQKAAKRPKTQDP